MRDVIDVPDEAILTPATSNQENVQRDQPVPRYESCFYICSLTSTKQEKEITSDFSLLTLQFSTIAMWSGVLIFIPLCFSFLLFPLHQYILQNFPSLVTVRNVLDDSWNATGMLRRNVERRGIMINGWVIIRCRQCCESELSLSTSRLNYSQERHNGKVDFTRQGTDWKLFLKARQISLDEN